MVAPESPVTRHPCVLHQPVQGGTNLQRSRPVFRDERVLQSGQVGLSHVHEPALGPRGHPFSSVPEPNPPGEDAPAKIELLSVIEDLHGAQVEPILAGPTERQGEPIRQIDQVFVLYGPAVQLRDKPAVTPREIRPKVVPAIGSDLRRGSTGGKAAWESRADGVHYP